MPKTGPARTRECSVRGQRSRILALVEGQAFFTTVAGLAVSLAGFGAVIAWLRDDPTTWDPVSLWRVKTIVRDALTLAFLCLLLYPVYTLTNDDAATIRVGSAGIAVFAISDVIRYRHPDPVIWYPRSSWSVFMVMTVAMAATMLVNIYVASLGVFQLVALVVLTSPAGIFFNFVREMGAAVQPVSEAEAGD